MTLWKWSKTAANNSNADSTINWAEGQAPSSVNDSARAEMAAVAKYRDDVSGMLNTGGSSTAYTVTTNQNLTALTDGFKITVRLHAANGAAATFSPDSLAAKALRTHTSTAVPSGAMNSGGIYTFTYDSGDDCWYVGGFFASTDSDFSDASFFVSDNSDATKKLAFQLSGVTTATTRTLTVPDASGTIMLTSAIGVTVQAFDADTLKSDVTATLTKGYNVTEADAGTKSSGTFTPSPADGNFQKAVNGGAHTLAPPSSSCSIAIQYTNNASAGAITTSGFTKVSGAFTTTNGDDFMCYITRINGFSHLNIVPLQ